MKTINDILRTDNINYIAFGKIIIVWLESGNGHPIMPSDTEQVKEAIAIWAISQMS